MWSDAAALLHQYAYLAIFVGAFFEGESTLFVSGLAAAQGNLALEYVFLTGALGGFAGDQTHFWTGRLVGRRILLRKPAWLHQSRRLLDAFARRQTLFLLGFRFLYGLRTLASVALGTCGLSPVRFAAYNLVGALLWATTVTSLGFLFGEPLLETFSRLPKATALWIAAGLAFTLLSVWTWRRKNRAATPLPSAVDGANRDQA